MKSQLTCISLLLLITTSLPAFAQEQVELYLLSSDKTKKSIGTVTLTDTRYGLLITPNLTDLPPGLHGFHLHTNPSCDQAGNAAGGHFDPKKTAKHLGPYNSKGHLGDLPALYVDNFGKATLPMVAPRLKVKTLQKHAVIIHAGSDNYADEPLKLGGGGVRIACGVVSADKPATVSKKQH